MTGDDPQPAGGTPRAATVDERLASLLETVSAFAALDFSRPAEVGSAGDLLDALAAGINMLGEEVEASTRELEERVGERTQQLEVAASELQAEVAERRRSETAVREAQKTLGERLAEVERLNREIAQLTELTNLLQVCATRQEAFEVLAQAGPELFPGTEGAVYTFVASRDVVQMVASWGRFTPPATIDPGDCWGLRRGQLHTAKGRRGLRCAHAPADWSGDQLCMPLIALGEVLGLLHLRCSTDTDGQPRDGPVHGTPPRSHERLAVAAAEQIALALANLELRAALQSQSIRDPLTNLYNRRYLDETLVRELHRAERAETPLSLLMIDIDRFKPFNDTYGHDAGDTALRQVAVILREQVRAEDVVCRFGGEEFAIVMAGVTTTEAATRAEHLRAAISDVELDWHGQPLGAITASFGVATYPGDAGTKANLIRAADTALYQAKNNGRDRVATYVPPSEAT
jgi:diguanylate cyclase (GGDEF)-like protein